MLQKNAMWSCHFNDNTYVNIPILKKKLKDINHELPYYFGATLNQMPIIVNGEIFWYAKNGACLSRGALEKISTTILNHKFYSDFIKHDKMTGEVALGYLTSKRFTIRSPAFL
uniref:Fringe-like glycosyltransferase domain-containing protein n=1 Tax=Panagrolaimus superbus TaxID=310955 RepID=A0A914YER3_9BILA